ncbi:MAG TPA: Holliday junction resolvase RuvX [Chloroflexota bacterium]|nr:Holliday junction resolvase RuvX [Chloroflexota bacterium]
MRVLALDVGDRRIGVALSDPTGIIASPLMTIHRSNEKRDQQTIVELVAEHEVEQVVIGMPWTLRGEVGPQAQKVIRFGKRLEERLSVPVVYWDERHSTSDAERIIGLRGRKRGRSASGRVDEVAAAVILQSYLDRLLSSASFGTPDYTPEDEAE